MTRDFHISLMATRDSKNPRRDIWLVVEIGREIWLSIGRLRGNATSFDNSQIVTENILFIT